MMGIFMHDNITFNLIENIGDFFRNLHTIVTMHLVKHIDVRSGKAWRFKKEKKKKNEIIVL